MRKRVSEGGVTVQAIAGNHAVFLGLDLSDAARAGCLGWSIHREDHTENEDHWLAGFKTFEAVVPNPDPAVTYLSSDHPMQTFYWGDYSAKPAHDYTYRLVPRFGAPGALKDHPWRRGFDRRHHERPGVGHARRLLQPRRRSQPGIRAEVRGVAQHASGSEAGGGARLAVEGSLRGDGRLHRPGDVRAARASGGGLRVHPSRRPRGVQVRPRRRRRHPDRLPRQRGHAGERQPEGDPGLRGWMCLRAPCDPADAGRHRPQQVHRLLHEGQRRRAGARLRLDRFDEPQRRRDLRALERRPRGARRRRGGAVPRLLVGAPGRPGAGDDARRGPMPKARSTQGDVTSAGIHTLFSPRSNLDPLDWYAGGSSARRTERVVEHHSAVRDDTGVRGQADGLQRACIALRDARPARQPPGRVVGEQAGL